MLKPRERTIGFGAKINRSDALPGANQQKHTVGFALSYLLLFGRICFVVLVM